MKKISIALLLTLPFIQSFTCTKDFYDPHDPNNATVKMSVSVNKTSETITLGDTLNFKLVVPDTLDLISKINGSVKRTAVTSLETCSFIYYLYLVDSTGINRLTRIIDNSAFTTDAFQNFFEIYISNHTKPFTATLTVVPKVKGLYYLHFGTQETRIKLNNSINGGLRVNFNVTKKHWPLVDPYLPGFLAAAQKDDIDGFGWYCFRVK